MAVSNILTCPLLQNDNDYASIFFNGINFAPSESSIEVAYSSDPEFEAAEYQQESTDDDDDNTTMIIIIIVCVVAGVLLIVGTVVSIVVSMIITSECA